MERHEHSITYMCWLVSACHGLLGGPGDPRALLCSLSIFDDGEWLRWHGRSRAYVLDGAIGEEASIPQTIDRCPIHSQHNVCTVYLKMVYVLTQPSNQYCGCMTFLEMGKTVLDESV